MKGSVLKAALMGGILSGTANSILLPVDCCCLVWGAFGGGFAVWVLLSDSEGQASGLRCLLASLMAGGVTGMVTLPLGAFFGRLMLGEEAILNELAEAVEAIGGLSDSGLTPEQTEALLRGWQFVDFNAWSVVGLVVMAFLFSFPALMGGSAALMMLRRPAPPSPERTVLFGEGAPSSGMEAGPNEQGPDASTPVASAGGGRMGSVAEEPLGDVPIDPSHVAEPVGQDEGDPATDSGDDAKS